MPSQQLKTGLILLGAAVAVAALVLGLNMLNRGKPGPGSQAAQAANGPAPQSQEAGGVTLQVTFDPTSTTPGQPVTFKVSMDTHSLELAQFDLAKLSRLTLQPGGTLTPTRWKPDGEPGGHHVGGALTFNDPSGLTAKAKSISLVIQGVAGADRSFQWPGTGQ